MSNYRRPTREQLYYEDDLADFRAARGSTGERRSGGNPQPRFYQDGLVREFDDVPSPQGFQQTPGRIYPRRAAQQQYSSPAGGEMGYGMYSEGRRPETPRRMRQREMESRMRSSTEGMMRMGGGDRSSTSRLHSSSHASRGPYYNEQQSQHYNPSTLPRRNEPMNASSHVSSNATPPVYRYYTPQKSLPQYEDGEDDEEDDDILHIVDDEDEEDNEFDHGYTLAGKRGRSRSGAGGGRGGIHQAPSVVMTPYETPEYLAKGQRCSLMCVFVLAVVATILTLVSFTPNSVWFRTEHQWTQSSPIVIREVKLWADQSTMELVRCKSGVVQNTNVAKDSSAKNGITAIKIFTVLGFILGFISLVFVQVITWKVQKKEARSLKVLMGIFAPILLHFLCCVISVIAAYTTFAQGDDSLAASYCPCIAPPNQVYIFSCGAGISIGAMYAVVSAVLSFLSVIIAIGFVIQAKPPHKTELVPSHERETAAHRQPSPSIANKQFAPEPAAIAQRPYNATPPTYHSQQHDPEEEYTPNLRIESATAASYQRQGSSNRRHGRHQEPQQHRREDEMVPEIDYEDEEMEAVVMAPSPPRQQQREVNSAAAPAGNNSSSNLRAIEAESFSQQRDERRYTQKQKEEDFIATKSQLHHTSSQVQQQADRETAEISHTPAPSASQQQQSQQHTASKRFSTPSRQNSSSLAAAPVSISKEQQPPQFQQRRGGTGEGGLGAISRQPTEPAFGQYVQEDDGNLVEVSAEDDDDEVIRMISEESSGPAMAAPPEFIKDSESGTMLPVTDWIDVATKSSSKLFYSKKLRLYYDPASGNLFSDENAGSLVNAEVEDV